jgi:hypothetical protein
MQGTRGGVLRRLTAWLFGEDVHRDCDAHVARVRGEVMALKTELLHERLKVLSAEADLATLEMHVLVLASRRRILCDATEMIDRWRRQRNRLPLGSVRGMLESGKVRAIYGEDGRPEYVVMGEGTDVDRIARGVKRLMGALVVFALLAAPASAGSFWESLAIHGGVQGLDYATTEYGIAQRELAGLSVQEGNVLMRGTSLERGGKKLLLGVGLAVLDHEIGKRSKKAQTIERVAVVAGYLVVGYMNMKTAERALEGGRR